MFCLLSLALLSLPCNDLLVFLERPSDDVKRRAVKHYMDNFDFTGLRLDVAFRHLCGKLFLRAETQQVDRILQQFSARFWECNPAPLYHSADVVHALTYSIMLLNTDLHIADISNRMSRPQFVKNTLGTVLPSLNRTETESPYSMPAATLSAASLDDEEEGTLEGTTPNESSPPPTTRTQNYRRHPKNRSGSMTSWRGIMQHAGASSSALQLGSAGSDSPTTSRVSLNLPQGETNGSNGYLESPERRGSRDQLSATRKIWEQEMENFLKEVYDAIKKQQVVQPVSARASTSLGPASSLGRKGSMRNGPNDRMANLKRGSVRGLTSLLSQQNNIATQPPPSGDGRVSPSPSFATSIGENLVTPSSTFYAPTLGFASNLSHSIIKEAQEDDTHSHHSADTVSTSVSISDEELALLGAPWAKEGMLCRKQFWETSKRRAKARNWMDVFVVISKGEFSMFTFGENGPSSAVTSVGGGNWLSNANLVGEFSLAHSLAHALPAPGYNRQRPYCFVLTLASGAVYFFQAGTEELVSEWVSTCNYWAARQSREPLSGGVSNMEYGWSRVENPAEADAPDNASLYRRDHSDSMSIRSGRSGRLGRQASTLFGSMPAERMFIHEWKPPMHPSIASTNDEETQLDSLQKQVGNLKLELEKHNALRRPMQDLFAAKSNNSTKAMNNWEQKSQYLLSELVKYQSYVDSLREGMNLRLKRRGDRALERALREPKDEDEDVALKPTPSSSTAKSTAPPSSLSTPPQTLGRRASGVRPSLSVQETIQEAEEPITPNPFGTLHRRAGADSGR
ncbi:SEC7-like protein [Clavulina sp. PMI_390]|nr:SEC7-like protein [Clavulina sp. PMI_390]